MPNVFVFFSGFLANRKDFCRALRALLLSGQWEKGSIKSGLKTHKWTTSQGDAVVKFCGICSSLSIRPKSSIFWDLTEKDLHVWINDNLEPSICFILYYWMIWSDTIQKYCLDCCWWWSRLFVRNFAPNPVNWNDVGDGRGMIAIILLEVGGGPQIIGPKFAPKSIENARGN